MVGDLKNLQKESLMSKKFYRRDLPLIIGTIAGIILIIQYFVSPNSQINTARGELLIWASICASFGVLVGAVGVIMIHVERVAKGATEARAFSTLLLGTVTLFVIVAVSYPRLTASPQYALLYTHIGAALASSVRAVAFCSCLIGAYRAFRVQSVDALVMFIAGSIYLVRGLTIGPYLLPAIVPIGDWIAQVPNVAATRGGTFAATVGALILAIRVFAGREKSVEEMAAEA